MKSPRATLALTTLTWAVALAFACAGGSPAHAGDVTADSSRLIRISSEPVDRNLMRLGRAAMEQRRGNLRGVVENLETIDFSAGPPFAEADRAAFLLGEAYLELGSVESFVRLARSLARWQQKSLYTRWLEYQRVVIETQRAELPRSQPEGTPLVPNHDHPPSSADRSTGSTAADELEAALLLRQSESEAALRQLGNSSEGEPVSPIALEIEALARARAGGDVEAALTALSTADTVTALGRDLAGAALIQRATRAMTRNQDARELLEKVPAGSRYASRSRHMLGLLALERGESERGTEILESLLAADSNYSARREVRQVLAGQALDQGKWEAAYQAYAATDQDWSRNRDALEHLMEQGSFDQVWSTWQTNPASSPSLMLDDQPARQLARHLAAQSADLSTRPSDDVPPLRATVPLPNPSWAVTPPAPDAWSAVAASEERLAAAEEELELARWAAASERQALEDRRGFFRVGRQRVFEEESLLVPRTKLLKSFASRIDSLDAELRSVRDEEGRRIAMRAAEILETGGKNLLWMNAMRHFYLGGPDSNRVTRRPQGFPGPQSVLSEEEALTRALQAVLQRMAADMPALLARSYERAWGPGLIDRAIAQSAAAAQALMAARTLEASIDSSLATFSTSDALRALESRIAALEHTTESLRAAHAALRASVAREAIQRAITSLSDEREAIDYGLAASTYALSVRLRQRDSTDTRIAVPAQATASIAHDSLRAGLDASDELEDAEGARWRGQAIPLLEAFLEHHPHSLARAEMRFRLADLELIAARQTFREQMTRFVHGQAEGGGARLALPVLDHASALKLYRKILAEDPDFKHLDAVQFNAGMILADEGDPEAAQFFDALVHQHPESRYTQEAYLRMGDMQFNLKRFLESVELYAHAVAGPDPTLQVIANYKMGWAHFNQDRFPQAADAFRSVLDLYASERRKQIQVEIESESEAYLVYSLAGAGGAEAFGSYFDRIGARPYERRILMSLGQHFRHYGQYPQAAAADELLMRRYPFEPDALVSGERLVETYQRSNRPALEQEARLSIAVRFGPGSDWAAAQASDSVRAAGDQFARSSWMSVALAHHLKARETGSREEWAEALRLYETLLSHWPHDTQAPSLELDAGEASAQLRDWAGALRHYGAAAASGRDTLAANAMWQCVAVTDAWYESTRSGVSRGLTALGSDSLAHAVIEVGDRLLARFPDHVQGASIMWRQSQLAFAHGWYERAAKDLERLTTQHPNDSRVPVAASQRADALYRLGQFENAGAAYEEARIAARRFGRDSLEQSSAKAIPVCYYRAAETAVATDSTQFERHAALFERVASRWPEYEHAHLAQYRAGLAYLKAGRLRESVRAMQTLIERFPKSEYARDARLQIARSWETMDEREQAAQAYIEFAEHDPADSSAGPAMLKAADLLTVAGQIPRADDLRLAYIRRYPGDVETAMEIFEGLARRDLAMVGPEHPISALLPVASSSRNAAKTLSHLAEYLRLAAKNPRLTSRTLLAQVRFLQAEEANTVYSAARLVQPLPKSIAAKQKLLDSVLVRYRRSVDLGVPEWAHASAFRIGQALAGFGEALEHSERPADLHGDDLHAYEDVLMEQSRAFRDRGEGVWADLLRKQGAQGPGDVWITQAQASLWQRLGNRFLFRPEMEFPLVSATAPAADRALKRHPERVKISAREASHRAHALAQQGGSER